MPGKRTRSMASVSARRNMFFSRVDDRLFIHRVESDFSKATIFEITPSGNVTERLIVPGYGAYPILRIR
jgi:hypothetical protein